MIGQNPIAEMQIEYANYPSQDNEGYVPDRGGFKSGWLAAYYYYKVLKTTLAFEIAIEALRKHSCCMVCEPCPGCSNKSVLDKIEGMLK